MNDDPRQDPREVAAAIGKLTGREAIATDVLSGHMPARDIAPLLGGLVDGAITSLLVPMTRATNWSGFDAATRPLIGIVTLLDGSRIRVTIEALS